MLCYLCLTPSLRSGGKLSASCIQQNPKLARQGPQNKAEEETWLAFQHEHHTVPAESSTLTEDIVMTACFNLYVLARRLTT